MEPQATVFLRISLEATWRPQLCKDIAQVGGSGWCQMQDGWRGRNGAQGYGQPHGCWPHPALPVSHTRIPSDEFLTWKGPKQKKVKIVNGATLILGMAAVPNGKHQPGRATRAPPPVDAEFRGPAASFQTCGAAAVPPRAGGVATRSYGIRRLASAIWVLAWVGKLDRKLLKKRGRH